MMGRRPFFASALGALMAETVARTQAKLAKAREETTNTPPPTASESRQVRRARERATRLPPAKGGR